MKNEVMSYRLNFGLEKSAIDEIVGILERNPKIDKVVLFGSRAKGNFLNGSDIDLALKGNGLNLNDILKASIEIDHLLLPNQIDFIIYDRITEKTLQEHIDRVGIPLFERQKSKV